MILAPFIAVCAVCAVFSVDFGLVWVRLRLPEGPDRKAGATPPGLAAKDGQLAARALRQFFLAHLKSGRRIVAMPSQVADDLWREFIL